MKGAVSLVVGIVMIIIIVIVFWFGVKGKSVEIIETANYSWLLHSTFNYAELLKKSVDSAAAFAALRAVYELGENGGFEEPKWWTKAWPTKAVLENGLEEAIASRINYLSPGQLAGKSVHWDNAEVEIIESRDDYFVIEGNRPFMVEGQGARTFASVAAEGKFRRKVEIYYPKLTELGLGIAAECPSPRTGSWTEDGYAIAVTLSGTGKYAVEISGPDKKPFGPLKLKFNLDCGECVGTPTSCDTYITELDCKYYGCTFGGIRVYRDCIGTVKYSACTDIVGDDLIYCESVLNCKLDTLCTGKIETDCAKYYQTWPDDPYKCEFVGCSPSYEIIGYACTGTPYPCSHWPDPDACTAAGCTWSR